MTAELEAGRPTLAWLARVNRLTILSRLLTSVIHDANNALQVVNGSLELLQPTTPPTTLQRRVQTLTSQAARVSELLRGLRLFAKDARSEPVRVGLHETVSRLLAMRQHALRQLRITTSVVGEEVFVHVNPRHLEQVLLNLLLNAEDVLGSRPQSLVAITITTSAGGGTVTIDDNGPGVPQPETVFELRLNADHNTPNLGTGLAVSYWLTGLMGGTLCCAASPAGGAQFTLVLPLSGH